jgi:hypothetical protein
MTNISKKRFAKNMKRKKLKQTRNSRPALWSVPIPKHNLPSIGGKVRLYHYTPIDRIGSIMTYGLIKGDVVGDKVGGRNWNAPNLTSQNEFHNPANRGNEINEEGYLRLEIYFDEKDRNIVPFGWFDRTYCGDRNREVIWGSNVAGNQNGDIDKQYLYKGPIFPQMIKKVSVWNGETGYWDRLSKNKILELTNIQSLPTLSFMGRNELTFDLVRMCGFSFDDWTGQIREFYAKTDDREVMKPLYELTDYINDTLQGRKLRDYKRDVTIKMTSGKYNETILFIMDTYGELFGRNEISKEPVGLEWIDNLRDRQLLWDEKYGDGETLQLKNEFRKVA